MAVLLSMLALGADSLVLFHAGQVLCQRSPQVTRDDDLLDNEPKSTVRTWPRMSGKKGTNYDIYYGDYCRDAGQSWVS